MNEENKNNSDSLKKFKIDREKIEKGKNKAIEIAKNISSKSSDAIKNASNKTVSTVSKAKAVTVSALDVNNDGNVDIEDIIILALKAPGIKIDRDAFIKKELVSKYDAAIVEKAIYTNLSNAGISLNEIDEIANNVINNERLAVSGISTALGTPGGVAMAATIPTDIIQYYGYTLRAIQKLMYLYGYPELNLDENQLDVDSQTMNTIILMLGTMYGVGGAANAVKVLAHMLGTGVQKQLMKKALTKGIFYPVIKEISKWFGVKMTKSIFTGFFKKAIPLAGGVLSGGITYLSFKPCCDKLQVVLRDTIYVNPDRSESTQEKELYMSFINDDVVDI